MEEIVRDGYNAIAEKYLAWRNHSSNLPYLDRLLSMLPAGAHVLDAGCGSGVPAARYLVDHGCAVAGIDISERQIELAQRLVPEGTFSVRSMTSLREGEYHVDGVASLYAVFHLPREQHELLFRTFRTFLPPGGPLLLILGTSDWEGVEEDWHGATMAWSGSSPKRTARLLESAGFEVVFEAIDRDGEEQYSVFIATRGDEP